MDFFVRCDSDGTASIIVSEVTSVVIQEMDCFVPRNDGAEHGLPLQKQHSDRAPTRGAPTPTPFLIPNS